MIEIQMDVYDFFMLEILYHKVFSSAWMNIIFQFWHFPPIFVQLKLSCLVTLRDHKLKVFKHLPKYGSFLAFLINFCPLKCKRSSLRSQC